MMTAPLIIAAIKRMVLWYADRRILDKKFFTLMEPKRF